MIDTGLTQTGRIVIIFIIIIFIQKGISYGECKGYA